MACGLSTMSCSTTCCTLPTAARPRRPSRAVPSRRPCRCDRRDRVTSPCRVYVQHCVCVCVCVCVSAALSRQADTSRQWPRVVSGAEELCYRVFCKDCGAPSALRCMWQRAVTPTPCGHAPGPRAPDSTACCRSRACPTARSDCHPCRSSGQWSSSQRGTQLSSVRPRTTCCLPSSAPRSPPRPTNSRCATTSTRAARHSTLPAPCVRDSAGCLSGRVFRRLHHMTGEAC